MMPFEGTPKPQVAMTVMGEIIWSRHDCVTAPLNYRGHMRLLQGASLSELFLPLVLLKGAPDPVWRVPFELHDVILAEVHDAPEGMSLEQITLELMKIVLAPVRGS